MEGNMRLEKLILKNFRSYSSIVEIPISNLTTLIGKNDIGKSTILEALEIYFIMILLRLT